MALPQFSHQPGACFVAGTLVATESGLRPIEDIKAGDRVWSFDCEKQEWVLAEIEATSAREYTGDIVTIEIEASDGTRDVIQATANHPFWVEAGENLHERPWAEELPADEPRPSEGGRWVAANSLEICDTLVGRSQVSARIIALQTSHDSLPVYNLSVDRLRTFAVGPSSVLVHNNRLCTGARLKKPQDGHIVPKGMIAHERGQIADRLRKHLRRNGIDIDDKELNMFMALDTTHHGTHRTGFLRWLEDQIGSLRGAELEDKLREIRRDLEDGTLIVPSKYFY